MATNISSSCLNILPSNLEKRSDLNLIGLSALVSIVATAAITAVVLGGLSIYGQMGPLAGLGSGVSLGFVVGGGAILIGLLVTTAISILRSRRAEKPNEVQEQVAASSLVISNPTERVETSNGVHGHTAVSSPVERTSSPPISSSVEIVREATIEEWRTQFPINALRRLEEKTPVIDEALPTLNADQVAILEAKLSLLYGAEDRAIEAGVHLHASGDHTVFEIDGLPGLIFKMPSHKPAPPNKTNRNYVGEDGIFLESKYKHDLAEYERLAAEIPLIDRDEATEYLERKEQAKRICREEGLFLMQIPPAAAIEVSDVRYQRRIIIVEKVIPNLRGDHVFQQQLYQWGLQQPELRPYFHRLFQELHTLICQLGFGDCKYNNIPISLDGNVCLIDLDNWGAALGLLRAFAGGDRNKGYKNQGLFNYLPSGLLDEFFSRTAQTLGSDWLQQFISTLEEGDEWLDQLARKELGASIFDSQKLEQAVLNGQENSEQLIALVGRLSEEDGWLRSAAQKIAGCPLFLKDRIDEKVREIKSNPEAEFIPFIREVNREHAFFMELGAKLIVEQKIAEIREHPELILEIIRRRIEKRTQREEAFERFLTRHSSEGEVRIREFDSIQSTIDEMKSSRQIKESLSSELIYETAKLIVEGMNCVMNEGGDQGLSRRRKIELPVNALWGIIQRRSMFSNKQSIVKREGGGRSLKSNLPAALKLLQKEGVIFRFKYDHPQGIKAATSVFVEC